MSQMGTFVHFWGTWIGHGGVFNCEPISDRVLEKRLEESHRQQKAYQETMHNFS